MPGHALRGLSIGAGILVAVSSYVLHRMRVPPPDATNFFDGYILISEESLRKSTSQAFENLLDLLGWAFDRGGLKAT